MISTALVQTQRHHCSVEAPPKVREPEPEPSRVCSTVALTSRRQVAVSPSSAAATRPADQLGDTRVRIRRPSQYFR